MKLGKKAVMPIVVTAVALLLIGAGLKNILVNATQMSQTGMVTIVGEGSYTTLADAVSSAQSGSVLQLNGDITETLTISKDVTLDLNGHSIDGVVTVATGKTLTVKDAATDDFTVTDGYGKIKAQGNVKADKGYIAIREDDEISCHRLDLQISAVTLRPSEAGLYYSSNFGGDEIVKDQIVTYGTALSLYGVPTAAEILADTYAGKHTAFAGESWVCGATGKANGTLLSGIMKQSNTEDKNAANAEMKIYSVSYVQLQGGSVVLGAPVETDLRQVVEEIDTFLNTLSRPEFNALKEMYATYKGVAEDWNVPNLAAEETKTQIYGSKVDVVAGESVTVTVSVKNNPGILGMLLSVEFDESVLTLTGASNGTATSALTYQNPSRFVSGCNFLWYGIQTGEVVDGTVLNLTFRVADSASAGMYPITIICSSADTYDANYNLITASVVDGAIIVTGQSSVVTHTVTFNDYDGMVLKTEKVEDGKAATAPTVPAREGYEFVGWDKDFSRITSDLVVTAQYAQEATGPKIYGDKVIAAAGDTVTVVVSVKNNPGILGMLLSVEFDESVLTLTGASNGMATSALTYQNPSRFVSGCNFLWYGSRSGTIVDGSVLTLIFEVADKAPAGTYSINLSCNSQDTYDGNYNPIFVTVADGAVVVE